MKITSVEPVLVAIPYEQGAPKPPSTQIVSWEKVQILFVRVQTDEGLTGWGEAFAISGGALTAKAVTDYVGKLAVGRTFTTAARFHDEMKRAMNSVVRAGGPVAYALSGLDIALWDIEGKAAGKPVWRLLGGGERKRVPAYASLFRLGEPRYVESVCRTAAARGYRSIKLHEYTPEAVAAARRGAGPDVSITVDVNCHWTSLDEITAFCDAVKAHDISWLEEPLYPSDAWAMHAELRKRVKVPIAAGENLSNAAEVEAMLAAGGLDILQPSTAKIGGVTGVWRCYEQAKRLGARCVPHSPFHGPALLAAVHIVAAMQEDVPVELRYCDLEASPFLPSCEGRGGMLDVPQGPGLGVEVDLAVVEKYRLL